MSPPVILDMGREVKGGQSHLSFIGRLLCLCHLLDSERCQIEALRLMMMMMMVTVTKTTTKTTMAKNHNTKHNHKKNYHDRKNVFFFGFRDTIGTF